MRRKLITIAVIIAAIAIIVGMVACKPPTPTPNPKDKAIVAILPDLIDYGQETYWEVSKEIYAPAEKIRQIDKLKDKQDESRDDYKGDSDWDSAKYYSFDKPHFELQGANQVWIEDDATTVTKVFCYSEPVDILERMAKAGVDESRMIELVAYITRDDTAYDGKSKGDLSKYPLIKGEGSAIHDYDNLDEVTDIRDNFDDYAVGTGDNKLAFGHNEDFWEDLVKLKKRKIDAETFEIFDDRADMFARFQLEYVIYHLFIIREVMIPAYKLVQAEKALYTLGSSTTDNTLIDSNEFKDYMREELFDLEMLSYFLAFSDLSLPIVGQENYWTSIGRNRAKIMTLYGYTYQYEKKSFEVFDDTKKVGERTEYEDYLFLGHQDYFPDNLEPGIQGQDLALRYTEYDRRNYREAYRYSADFYKKYYQNQYELQSKQEERDREIYTDSIEYEEGIDYATSAMVTYTDEMIQGLDLGFAESLKISDVNYEYSGNDDNVKQYNRRNTDWNGLTKAQKEQRGTNAIKKVLLEIKQLESQHYVLTHRTITQADLVQALKYQVKSYSADYIRAIQDNKKEQVLARRELKRAFNFFTHEYEYIEIKGAFGATMPAPETYEEEVVEDKIESLSRSKAMYSNLYANYSGADIAGQIDRAKNTVWSEVASCIQQTIANDKPYINFVPRTGYYVDDLFQDNLIKKVWDCGGVDDDHCGIKPEDNQIRPHFYLIPGDDEPKECKKIYSSEWALSRFLNEYEDVFRHMAGQTQVTFKKVQNFSGYNLPEKTQLYYSYEIQKVTAKRAQWLTHEEVTVDPGDEISTVVLTSANKVNYQPSYKDRDGYTSVLDDPNGNKHTFGGCDYVFDVWCVDEDLLYAVKPEDKIRFDIRLYARYKIENVNPTP